MTLWFTARGAALAALTLLTLATALGAVGSAKSLRPERRVLSQYLHRTAALLGLSLLIVHITSIVLDTDAGVGVSGALIPFTSGYRAGSVAFGTLAVYTFLLVSALGLARGRMARSARATRAWRGIHLLAYAGWGMAMWHGFFTGTDSDLPWVRGLYLACLLSVVSAVAIRLTRLATVGHLRRAMESPLARERRQLQGAAR
jgi:hypothetical protein